MKDSVAIPGIVPGEYSEDLYLWLTAEDVPPMIRDLPALYGIGEQDLRLPYPAVVLKDRVKDPNPKLREEALDWAKRAYFLLLNLMRHQSGLEFTTLDVGKWPIQDLVGEKRHGRINMGNARQRSNRVAANDSRYGTANDAEPGLMFRMLGHESNLYSLLASLRYFTGEESSPRAKARHAVGKEALKLVGLVE